MINLEGVSFEARDREAAERERQALLRSVKLQFDAEDFVRSDLGRYLVAASDAAREEALDALVTCDPTQAETIRKLQVDYRVASTWLDWIAQAIMEGQAAQQQLTDADN